MPKKKNKPYSLLEDFVSSILLVFGIMIIYIGFIVLMFIAFIYNPYSLIFIPLVLFVLFGYYAFKGGLK